MTEEPVGGQGGRGAAAVPAVLRSAARRLGCSAADVLALAVLAAGALLAVVLLWYLQSSAPATVEAPPADVSDPLGLVSASPSPTQLVVHVAGHVGTPGVYGLPAGSRVADALTQAGGPLPDAALDALNLARPLEDGEQVVVPAPGAAPVTAGTGGTGGPGAQRPDGTLDLNLATEADLDALPGIGPVLAR